MSEVLQANVFFLITSVAVVVFTILLCVALYHIIRILASVRRIVDRIEEGSEVIAEDMSSLRNYFNEGSFISRIVGLVTGQYVREQNTKKRTRKKSPREDEDINEA